MFLKHTRTPCILFFLTFFLIPLGPEQSRGDLYNSVVKNQKTEVNNNAISRLKAYDSYIDYFASLPYVSPQRTVHPHFIRALILAESEGKSDAVSEKDAIGLGQIRYPTGRQAAKELSTSAMHFRYVNKFKLASLTRADLFDPAVNILLTCYLVSRYNNQFDGRLDLVVSAWNAGENTQSLAENKHAPYKETESLIGKINGYYLFLLKHHL